MRPQSRWQAAGVQLLAAALIALALLGLMLGLWYPEGLFQGAGGDKLFYVLTGVNLVLGPVLTLVVFKPGKRGLETDFAIIVSLQVAALLYGGGILYTSRPAFVVFVKDRFEVATASEVSVERLAAARYPEFRQPPRDGPVLAAAEFPVDPKARKRILDASLEGFDMQHFPEWWVPYAERGNEVLSKAQTIAQLRAEAPETGRIVDRFLQSSGIKESEVRYVPLHAPRAWVAVLIDPQTAKPVKTLLAERIQ